MNDKYKTAVRRILVAVKSDKFKSFYILLYSVMIFELKI